MAKTNATDTADPTTTYDANGDTLVSGGLTKIEYMASQCLQGIMANPNTKGSQIELARAAVTMAKTLIQALNE